MRGRLRGIMRFLRVLQLVLGFVLLVSLSSSQRNNGKTTAVEWDRSSLYINGERVYIYAGEFHYPRLPVPELWLDIFQKLKAIGFNAVSIYFFWSYHSPSIDVLDFTTGARDIQRLFDYAAEAGIWVITRAGPYINAETSAGGLALWSVDGSHGVPRTGDEKYHQAWLPYITEVGKIFAENGVDKGGVVILNQHENEFPETYHDANWTGVVYMEQIKDAFADAGVLIPSTHNEIGMRAQSWSTDYMDVGGAVDIYGLDSYPNGFNCANPGGGFSVVRTYYQWFENYSPTQPSYMPEYQGGAFDPYGGYGYEACAQLTGEEFSDVFYKTLVAQKVSLMSFYMTFGGTNWGSLPAPVVYSSYDYGAHITESRQIRDKARQTKLLGLFLRVSQDLRDTVMVANGTGVTDSTSIYGVQLRNPDTNAGFYWVNQNTSSSRAVVNFGLPVTTSAGNLSISNIQLDGRESKIIVTDYTFGEYTLLYSVAEVLTYALMEGQTVLVLYINAGQTGEFVLKDVFSNSTLSVSGVEDEEVTTTAYQGSNLKITYRQRHGKVVLSFGEELQIWLVDRITGWNIWAPTLTLDPNAVAAEQILVQGPYLVRSAALTDNILELQGDTNDTTTIEVAAGAGVETFTWNGQHLNTTKSDNGIITGQYLLPASIALPDLSTLPWQAADSLVEKEADYDDSNWVDANHLNTSSPVPPDTLPVLYPDDYGFHTGYKLYRGYFPGSANASSVTLNITSGAAFGYSVFLNGIFLKSWTGSPSNTSATLTIPFGNATLQDENVLFVVHDYTGHDQTAVAPYGMRNLRGIKKAALNTGSFTKWKLIGNAGGEADLDPVRGVFNEGGLRAERLGWILPGYPTNSSSIWSSKSPLTGLSSPGIEFYRTTFDLHLPAGYDVPLALDLEADESVAARVQIYVNGYQYGMFFPHIGPQTRFPVPPGILEVDGENTIGISIWAQEEGGAKLSGLKLSAVGVYETSFDFKFDAEYLRPAWVEGERDAYA